MDAAGTQKDLSDVSVAKATHYHLLEISVKVSLGTQAIVSIFFNKILSISAIGLNSIKNGVEIHVASLSFPTLPTICSHQHSHIYNGFLEIVPVIFPHTKNQDMCFQQQDWKTSRHYYQKQVSFSKPCCLSSDTEALYYKSFCQHMLLSWGSAS